VRASRASAAEASERGFNLATVKEFPFLRARSC